MKKLIRNGRALARKASVVALGTVAAAPVMADGGIEDAINGALSLGTSNVTTVVVGIVGIAAIALGLSIILGLMRKS